jgi:hypothetical protein
MNVEPLLGAAEPGELVGALHHRRTAVDLPVAVVLVVEGMPARPGILRDRIHHAEHEAGDAVGQEAAEQRVMPAVVHQPETPRGEQHHHRAERQQQPRVQRQRVRHQPPQDRQRSEGLQQLPQRTPVAAGQVRLEHEPGAAVAFSDQVRSGNHAGVEPSGA